MRVAIVGYGTMGRQVEKILTERGHDVAARVDPVNPEADHKEPTEEIMRGCEAAIEFSIGSAVLSNARMYSRTGVAAVVGTTGWEDVHSDVKELFAQRGAYLHGSNFSIGAHVFFAVAERLSRIIDSAPQYDLMVHEIHHNRKKDSPSGTALSVAKRIVDAHSRKTRIVTERLDRQIEPHELHVSSTRGGAMPGIHSVIADSEADTIEVTHSVRNRSGLALGAVLAAEWLVGRTGFYEVEDFIEELLNAGGNT